MVKGGAHDAITRAKISAAKTGVERAPFSDETRAKMSVSQRKRVVSPETRAKLSLAKRAADLRRKEARERGLPAPVSPRAKPTKYAQAQTYKAPSPLSIWCSQCDKIVGRGKIKTCASKYCKVKGFAANIEADNLYKKYSGDLIAMESDIQI